MSRTIGIQHRIKRDAQGEARPTLVCIQANGSQEHAVLKSEADELAFINTIAPGDLIAMQMGGSGGYLSYAASRIAKDRDAHVLRIPPFVFRKLYPEDNDDVSAQLIEAVSAHRDRFYPVGDFDATHILAREQYREWQDAMKARIACQQRLWQRTIGAIYTSPDGLFPEGGIEKAFDRAKANDATLKALKSEEAEALKRLKKTLETHRPYRHVMEPIEGVGPSIGMRIMYPVQDIRLFEKGSQLKKYLGVHVLPDGRFPRKRTGEIANWHEDARKGLFLLGDQMNKRPESKWGRRLRVVKANIKERHPDPVVGENGVQKWTPMHIHRTAVWRTAGIFVEHVHSEWRKLALEDAQTIR